MERPDLEYSSHPLLEISRSEREYARARVAEELREPTYYEAGVLRLLIVSGPYSGDSVYVQTFPLHYRDKIPEQKRLLISYDDKEGPENILIEGVDRVGPLLILVLVFVGLVVIICGKRGLKSLLALILGIVVLRFIFLPMAAGGESPVLWALLTSMIMVLATMLAVGGWGAKSKAAILGAFTGIGTVALITVAFLRLSGIIGFFMEEISLFNYIQEGNYEISFFRQFIAASVILGASGVIMDAAISVSSSMQELKGSHPTLSRRRFYESGLSVGGDISSTMVNTLIMAYLGGMIGMIMAKSLEVSSAIQLLNLPFFSYELCRALAGASGFLVAVWVSVWASSLAFTSYASKSKT